MNRFWRATLVGSLLAAGLGFPRLAFAAGVTVITHGFNGDAQGWVLGMAQRVPFYPAFPGTNVICYEVRVTDSGGIVATARKVSGPAPILDSTAEIMIKLDWGDLAGFFSQYDTYEVAAAVVPRLLQTNFIAELNGHALAELPLHLVGHSRGGSLVCQLSLLLGTNGVWVDHVTTLDPHPVNEDGNTDPLVVSDAPLRIYENVLFADNYYQDFGGYPHGQFMNSSFNRYLTALPGGYSSAHSDTHLWYHATIDGRQPANDTEATLAAGDRTAWFTAYEMRGARAGFYYSLLGGGDRFGTDQPGGPGTDRPFFGYNARWDFGAGGIPNRTALPRNHGLWPNPLQFHWNGPSLVAQGQTHTVSLTYQWARDPASNAMVNFYLDDDLNPFNGNERLLQQRTVSGTTSNNISAGSASIGFAANATTPGVHALYASINSGGRTRYLYAPEPITLVSSLQPPALAITRDRATARVEVRGVPGQRLVLETAGDLRDWRAVTTNWLTTTTWTFSEAIVGPGQKYYRAVLR